MSSFCPRGALEVVCLAASFSPFSSVPSSAPCPLLVPLRLNILLPLSCSSSFITIVLLVRLLMRGY